MLGMGVKEDAPSGGSPCTPSPFHPQVSLTHTPRTAVPSAHTAGRRPFTQLSGVCSDEGGSGPHSQRLPGGLGSGESGFQAQ